MIKKFETYIKENKGDDEIIYIKDLYDKYRFLFHMFSLMNDNDWDMSQPMRRSISTFAL